jgi:sugar lactone lactonase YvrE
MTDRLVSADVLSAQHSGGLAMTRQRHDCSEAMNHVQNYSLLSCRLLFADIPTNAVMQWKDGNGISQFLKPSGYSSSAPFTGKEPGSNGLTFDSQGRLVLCERGDRRIARLEADGHKTTLVDRYQAKLSTKGAGF